MSHDTEPEEVELVSIVEREAEEAYPVQYWDGSDIKKTFEADSDDLQEAYMNGVSTPLAGRRWRPWRNISCGLTKSRDGRRPTARLPMRISSGSGAKRSAHATDI